MFKKTAALLAATLVTALAGPALAAPPYTITVGTLTSGTYGYSGASTGAVTVTINGSSGPTPLNCTSSVAIGTVKPGVSSTGLNVGTISASIWSGCTLFGLPLTVSHGGTWSLNLNGTATNGVLDNVTGSAGNVVLNLASATPGLCSFKISGTADTILKETVTLGGVQELDLAESAGHLTVSSVSGCLGAVMNGSTVTVNTAYKTTSPEGPINVKP